MTDVCERVPGGACTPEEARPARRGDPIVNCLLQASRL